MDVNDNRQNEQKEGYNGKRYTVPQLSVEDPALITPRAVEVDYESHSQVIQDIHTPFNISEFITPRTPISFGKVDGAAFVPTTPRVLDMPIKFPGTNYRLPQELSQFESLVQRVADIEALINPHADEYYCYLTIDHKLVKQGTLQREAPVHVDGFVGARWKDPVPVNHSYIVGNCLPTVFYPQPFLLDMLDIEQHDVFWEMNRQVAMTNSHYATTFEPLELTMMNAYCAHRGDVAPNDMQRTWVRLSFETRIYDRLGNAHNPLFDYNWNMVERDIEQLNLRAYDETCDPSLRVFPWQALDGSANPPGVKTMPQLRPFDR